MKQQFIMRSLAVFVLGLFFPRPRYLVRLANIEQGTLQVPNIGSIDRLTGKAVFIKTGDTGGVDLGDILLSKLDYNPKRVQADWHIDGNVVQAIEETLSVAAVYSLQGHQFTTHNMALMLLGSRNADNVQATSTGATFNFTAKLGQSFDIGARNITNVVVTVSAATKVADTDYFLEANKGLIRIPNVAAGIADAASVTVTFDKPAITRDSFTAFNNLNLQGTLKVFEMDNQSPIPKNEWAFVGNITTESGGDTDPAKHRQWSLRFSVTGQPTCIRRRT